MTRTALVTTIAIITVAIYDLIVVVLTGTGASVSRFLIDAGFESPLFVFGSGFICGHLFGYMKPKDDRREKKETRTP